MIFGTSGHRGPAYLLGTFTDVLILPGAGDLSQDAVAAYGLRFVQGDESRGLGDGAFGSKLKLAATSEDTRPGITFRISRSNSTNGGRWVQHLGTRVQQCNVEKLMSFRALCRYLSSLRATMRPPKGRFFTITC